jgi:hypothetical protein
VWAAGAIVVVYGSSNGLRLRGSSILSQQGPIAGVPQSFDAFGVALAVGDVDGDGHDDIAVGAPGKSIGAARSAGVVHVLFGSPRGVRPARNLLLGENSAGAAPAGGNAFGRSLTMGDFDADGRMDIAIGITGRAGGAGAVAVFGGSATGVVTPGRILQPGVDGVPGTAAAGAQWGRSLATGDFNGDGDDDLAVAAPFASVDGAASAGSVTVLGGSPGAGLTGPGGFVVTQREIRGASPRGGDQLGWALRSGDFNGDGVADLAVSARGENLRRADVGVVHVLAGRTGSSLVPNAAQTLSQAMRAVPERAEAGDRFGTAL